MSQPKILTDARWLGPHGIGRFTTNVLARLPQHKQLQSGPRRLSLIDPMWLSYQIALHRPDIFFSPGFSLPAVCPPRLIFTIHDLICMQLPAASVSHTFARKFYFRTIVKSAARRAYRVLTVSEYSRKELLKWTGLPPESIVNVGNGIDPVFNPSGRRYDRGFLYILYVGNLKPHKNIHRLVHAFARIDRPELRLLLTGCSTPDLAASVRSLGLANRVQFTGCVDDSQLAELYRGALLLVQPSLMEGFGLPPLEAMACGTPVVVSRSAALPEVVGDAGVLIDPLDIDDIRRGIERAISDQELRRKLIAAGRLRASMFRWDDVAEKVANVLGIPCALHSEVAASAEMNFNETVA
jgi:glycosyltransferase involved in cell wall biosynthesis